jgi:23S rRNA (cytosine1962-C5)-methyltransferase
MIKVILKRGKEVSVLRRHPWIFSGAIYKIEGETFDGENASVFASDMKFLGWGHYQDGSIAVRMLSYEAPSQDGQFWINALQSALEMRIKSAIIDKKKNNIFRLVHGEGDHLPGLVVDVYGSTAVVQCHSHGMFRNRSKIADALLTLKGYTIKAVFDKSAESLGNKGENSFLSGKLAEENCFENGMPFTIDFITGQKTGFFIDQRENRKLLGTYAKDKTVLNTFCYSGGFSVYALKGGAKSVTSVDSSKSAIALTDKNISLNGFDENQHKSVVADVMHWLSNDEEKYDVIVVDPPAFAKHISAKHRAVQAYKRLNIAAIKKVNKGGIVFTFSCSQVVDTHLFRSTIMAAAIEAGREVRILHQLSQGPDHPVNIFHPEGEYLKGLVLYIS